MANRFEESYRAGSAPWDVGKPDFNLIHTVTSVPIQPCKALEIGCGTGDNAIWLAQQKFDVVGIDFVEMAIEQARAKAQQAGVSCALRVDDALRADLPEAPFGFAFDRGCFHTIDSAEERARFARQVHRHLGENGLWLSLIGSADGNRQSPGPPKRSAGEITAAVEPCFEILSLVTSHFETRLPEAPKAWVCLMRKRKAE